MEYKQIKLEEVKESGYNPRQITPEELSKLKNSLSKFGCVRPLVINKTTGNLISGHQMLKAAKELKMKRLPYVEVEISDKEEKALNIALNKISGSWDEAKLSELLLNLDMNNLELTGFSDNEIDSIKTKYDFSDLSDQLKGYEEKAKDEMEWKAKVERKKFEEVKDKIAEIKKKCELGTCYSDYANGEVLIQLMEEIISHFKNPTDADRYFEDYEKEELKKNGEILIKLLGG